MYNEHDLFVFFVLITACDRWDYKRTAYVCLLLAHNEVFALISYCNIRPQGKQTHEQTIICDVMTKESPVCQ